MVTIALLLLAGALAGGRTLLHTLALATDDFAENLGWNTVGSITLSSRAAIAARHGRPGWSMAIGFLFGCWPPISRWRDLAAWRAALMTHGEDAMPADRDRTCASIETLFARDPDTLSLIAELRRRSPNP